MNNQNQNFESRGVSLTPAQWERCDRLTDEYGKKSRNSFIREAVDFSVLGWKRSIWNDSFCLLSSR